MTDIINKSSQNENEQDTKNMNVDTHQQWKSLTKWISDDYPKEGATKKN
jgi:hypothetical protein